MIVASRKALGAHSCLTRNRQIEIEIIVKELIEDYGLVQYPQSIQRVAEAMGVTLAPYSSLDASHRVIARAASDDAFSITTPDMTTAAIAFEDCAGSMHGRLRFTGGHELGHIVLEHAEDDPDREAEADYFSGYLLAPHPLVAKASQGVSIAEKFGISGSCAQFASDQAADRYREGGLWLPHESWILDHIVWEGGGLLDRP